MRHDNLDPELDDLLSDIHRLIDEDSLPGAPAEDEFTLDPLLDEELFALDGELPAEPVGELDLSALDDLFANQPEPDPEPEPEPEPLQPRWTDKQRVPRHVAKLQQNQAEAYSQWLYEQGQAAPQDRWTDRQRVPKHVAKLQKNQDQAYADWLYEQDRRSVVAASEPEEAAPAKKNKKKKQRKQEVPPVYEEEFPMPKPKKRHRFRNFLIFLVILALVMSAAVLFLLPRQPMAQTGSGTRKDGVSTILLLGTDAGGARTDTMMLLTVDQPGRQLSLVSIPRDTLVNGSYTVPKINSVYGANNGGAEGIEMVLTRVEQCIGFRPDGYILLQLDAFVDLVDALGGVHFDVPVDMFYNDVSQDLYIALEAGPQLLSGEEAMGLVRFRAGYADADLGRVQVQREFLSALLKQAVSANGIVRAPMLLQILLDHTQTDLTTGHFLWLARAGLTADLSNIQTATLPGGDRMIGDGSYYVLDPASVAQTVNTYCNPYAREITAEDLQIRQG